MSVLSATYFHDEAAAFAHVEVILWANGPVCPHCGGMDRIYALKDVKGKTGKVRHGLKKCGHCRKQFTVRIGTIFEESHLPMHKWLQAIYLMCSSKKGMSAHQLHRTLEVTYKTAWFLAHRIREAMRTGELGPIGGEGKYIEADTTFVGGREKNKHVGKRNPKAIGGVGKQIVHTLVERGGAARSHHIANVTGKTLRTVLQNVDRKSALMTDTAGGYEGSAYGSFDGTLRAVDFQPAMKRGVIRLSAGDVPIQCNITQVPLDEVSAALEKRAVFYGLAHYDGKKGLPRLVDIQRIELVPDGMGLARWRGAFNILEDDDGAWETH